MKILLIILSLFLRLNVQANELELSDIIKIFDNSQDSPKSVQDFLKKIPSIYKEKFAVQYSSRGLQGATEKNPRIVMFGATAQTVIAFNGDPSRPGFNTIEGFSYSKKNKAFEFFEVNFNKKNELQINPASCKLCHGANQHPIFGSYYGLADWTGFYGSEVESGTKFDFIRSTVYEKGYQTFLDNALTHPLYSELKLDRQNLLFPPFRNNIQFGVDYYNETPTLLLGKLLFAYNYDVLKKRIRSHWEVNRNLDSAAAYNSLQVYSFSQNAKIPELNCSKDFLKTFKVVMVPNILSNGQIANYVPEVFDDKFYELHGISAPEYRLDLEDGKNSVYAYAEGIATNVSSLAIYQLESLVEFFPEIAQQSGVTNVERIFRYADHPDHPYSKYTSLAQLRQMAPPLMIKNTEPDKLSVMNFLKSVIEQSCDR